MASAHDVIAVLGVLRRRGLSISLTPTGLLVRPKSLIDYRIRELVRQYRDGIAEALALFERRPDLGVEDLIDLAAFGRQGPPRADSEEGEGLAGFSTPPSDAAIEPPPPPPEWSTEAVELIRWFAENRDRVPAAPFKLGPGVSVLTHVGRDKLLACLARDISKGPAGPRARVLPDDLAALRRVVESLSLTSEAA